MKILIKNFSTKKWDSVNEMVFAERKHVENYNEQPYVKINGKIEIGGEVTPEDLSAVFRFCQISISPANAHGMIHEPETVEIRKGKSVHMHCLITGRKYKLISE